MTNPGGLLREMATFKATRGGGVIQRVNGSRP
jgi:hypothetical protein